MIQVEVCLPHTIDPNVSRRNHPSKTPTQLQAHTYDDNLIVPARAMIICLHRCLALRAIYIIIAIAYHFMVT